MIKNKDPIIAKLETEKKEFNKILEKREKQAYNVEKTNQVYQNTMIKAY